MALKKDAEERITVPEMIQHPWFKEIMTGEVYKNYIRAYKGQNHPNLNPLSPHNPHLPLPAPQPLNLDPETQEELRDDYCDTGYSFELDFAPRTTFKHTDLLSLNGALSQRAMTTNDGANQAHPGAFTRRGPPLYPDNVTILRSIIGTPRTEHEMDYRNVPKA